MLLDGVPQQRGAALTHHPAVAILVEDGPRLALDVDQDGFLSAVAVEGDALGAGCGVRVGISGHRGLDAGVEERVRSVLGEAVRGYDVAELLAVSCIADGPDAWFAEAVPERGGSEILVGPVDELLAVWDGKPARGYGGTADVVAYAERNGVPVRVLWPEGATR